jgi:cytochrome c-type biogenesis protein CcmH
MLFWIIACLIAALVAASLLPSLLRPVDRPAMESADMGVYRDQLAEVDRDLARGVLDQGEAERTRTEIARRLLAADKAGVRPGQDSPPMVNRLVAGIVAIGLTIGALGVYYWLGAPGYPDISRASRIAAGDAMRAGRISQAQAEALVPVTLSPDIPAADMALIAQLRTTVQDHPDSLQGWGFLADYESRIGNFPAAARAQEQVVALQGEAATVADYENLTDLQVAAAGGFISPEVELTLRRLLADDPENLTARYYTGLLYAQTDRPDIAFRLWRDLVAVGGDDLHVQLARQQVEQAAFLAGVDYELPPAVGPTAADIAAAQDMAPADQQAMIRGMVGQLSDRLATQGGPPGDWARLISSLGVLGDTDQARAIWVEAQGVFAADPAAMAQLLTAAQSAGVAP